MRTITVYDTSADALEERAEELGTTVEELVEELVIDYLDEVTG